MNGDDQATGRSARVARVRDTGIVLLHAGDQVKHGPGSDALLESVDQVVEYHFPVEIEVRSVSGPADWRQVAEWAANGLTDTLRSV
jgi:hypothetical protein